MSTNSLNTWIKLDILECGQNYSFCLETHEVRNDITGKIKKPYLNTTGYYRVSLYYQYREKHYTIHQLVWITNNGLYDTNKYVIDHIDHNKTNNSLGNLRLVDKSINNSNITHKVYNKQFDYKTVLPDAEIINKECGVYYCKQYDKFYRKISDTQYRELHEVVYKGNHRIKWNYKGKAYNYTITKYRMEHN